MRGRRMLATAAAVIVAVGLVGCAAAAAPSGHAASHDRASGLELTGFQEEGDPLGAITASAAALSIVGVDGVVLTDGGASVAMPESSALAQLRRAHRDHLRGELLVSNFDDGIGDFSPDAGATLLRSPANRHRVVARLASAVRAGGWDGLMIDLESLGRADGTGLSAFARELRAALGSGIQLDIAVMASTTPDGYREAGYQLARLADSVDHLTLMAYDQHGPWDRDHPGPVGALAWQKQTLAVVLDEVDPAQVDLGVAGYGYRFGPDDASAVGDAEARRLAGSAARFDRASGEWTATLADGTVLWWSDARSLALRRSMARAAGLHGAAIWSLGLSDRVDP